MRAMLTRDKDGGLKGCSAADGSGADCMNVLYLFLTAIVAAARMSIRTGRVLTCARIRHGRAVHRVRSLRSKRRRVPAIHVLLGAAAAKTWMPAQASEATPFFERLCAAHARA